MNKREFLFKMKPQPHNLNYQRGEYDSQKLRDLDFYGDLTKDFT